MKSPVEGKRDITVAMWMWMLVAFAGDFGREDERLRTTRYARLRGEGPVFGRYRNRRGAFLATHFRDGQIEHVDVYDGRTLTQTQTFAADGRPRAVVDWESHTVALPGLSTTVDFTDWTPVEVGGVSLRGPGLEEAGGIWTGARVAVELQPPAEPFTDAFAVALAAGCGCEIEARQTVWIAGRPAAHYRLQRPTATADLVAMPAADGTLVLTSAGPDLGSLATLRAMMATARRP